MGWRLVRADPVGVKTRSGTVSLACAAVTGVVAFVLFFLGVALLWTGNGVLLGWSVLALGLAAVVATAMLTLAGTRPDPR
jgi:Kef-type K+ transport system membrane component KefB